METLDRKQSHLEKLRVDLDLGNDQFCIELPWAKLYWLAGRMYFTVVKHIILSNLRSGFIRSQQLVSSAYEAAYQPSNNDFTRHRDLRRDIFLVKGRLERLQIPARAGEEHIRQVAANGGSDDAGARQGAIKGQRGEFSGIR